MKAMREILEFSLAIPNNSLIKLNHKKCNLLFQKGVLLFKVD
jgi:hypothetical protein